MSRPVRSSASYVCAQQHPVMQLLLTTRTNDCRPDFLSGQNPPSRGRTTIRLVSSRRAGRRGPALRRSLGRAPASGVPTPAPVRACSPASRQRPPLSRASCQYHRCGSMAMSHSTATPSPVAAFRTSMRPSGKICDAAEPGAGTVDRPAVGAFDRAVQQQQSGHAGRSGARTGPSTSDSSKPRPPGSRISTSGLSSATPKVMCSTCIMGAGPSVALQVVSDGQGAVLDRQPPGDGQPMAFPARGSRLSAVHRGCPRTRSRRHRGSRGSAVDGACVAGVGRHRLPSAAVAVGPGLLVELAGPRRQRVRTAAGRDTARPCAD